jgi:hypothetical protein
MLDAMVEEGDECLAEFIGNVGKVEKIVECHQLLLCMATSQMLKECICKLLQLIILCVHVNFTFKVPQQ